MDMNQRYFQEKARTELALRMIRHEARTSTIRHCTGLSDDRIRKLCTAYFGGRDGQRIRRRRGKSPRRISRFVKNAACQLEATTLMQLYLMTGLLHIQTGDDVMTPWQRPDITYGELLCLAYETYCTLHERPLFTFEWAWNLLRALGRNEELTVVVCHRCDVDYLHDRYALDFHVCPACEIRTERRRRPGARQFAGG